MCLSLFALHNHPVYELVLLHNRDEFHERPTDPAHFWSDSPQVFGGRDRRAGGSWLAVYPENGRVAFVTNVRQPSSTEEGLRSRGALVPWFLQAKEPLSPFAKKAQRDFSSFNPFSLVAYDPSVTIFATNASAQQAIRNLEAGIYGLSNAELNTPWPKVRRGKKAFRQALKPQLDKEELFSLMKDTSRPPDTELPRTGLSLERERLVSSLFVRSPLYGTRSTTLLLVRQGEAFFEERTFDPEGTCTGTVVQTLALAG